MSTDESKLVIRFEQLDREFNFFVKSWRIENSYTVSTDGWEAVLYHPDRTNLFGLELQPVELILNGNSQLLGRVDRTEIGGDGSAVTINGRDYLADLVECNVDPSLKVSEGDPLFSAITAAGFPVGIDTVVSDDDVAMRDVRSGKAIAVKRKGRGSKRKGAKLDDYKPHPGEGCYEYINRIVARFGCTVQPGPDRQTLVLCSPRYDQDPAYSISRTDDPASSSRNVIKTATAVRDFSKFPTYTIVTGQHVGDSGSAINASQHYAMDVLAQEFNDELGRILLETIIPGRRKFGDGQAAKLGFDQLYRLCTFRDTESRTQEQLTNAAKRVIADRLKDTLLYTVTLKGHTDRASGAVWAVDTMVQVDDAICNVHEPLWIASRTLEYSEGAGATTQLTCLRPNSYQIGSDA